TFDGPEPIEWIVLDRNDGEYTLISKYGLTAMPYNKEFVDTTWESCTLRAWLNGTFLNTAFSAEERARLIWKNVANPDNSVFGTNGGGDTKDKAWLLSIDEANKYFNTYEARQCQVTAYAKAQGASETSKGNGWWWLRSPGNRGNFAARINYDGSVYNYGDYVYSGDIVVRPVIVVSIPEEASAPDTAAAETTVDADNVITFGRYEQDDDLSNGPESIEWIVLETDGDTRTVISKYGLDTVPYNRVWTDVTWETCTLRTWLNDTFYHTAFTAEEQAQIIQSTLENPDNPMYGTSGGNATTDKVFVLSIDEAERCFDSNGARACHPTAYAKARRAQVHEDKDTGWWWLRSPGRDSRRAASVLAVGSVFSDGNYVMADNYNVVRPVICLELTPDSGAGV
ncbi:MAG: hypothetical protein IKE30_11020, partial [Clostridia bacterium]|nr:hypothetical protein [Clostridia bacterium]